MPPVVYAVSGGVSKFAKARPDKTFQAIVKEAYDYAIRDIGLPFEQFTELVDGSVASYFSDHFQRQLISGIMVQDYLGLCPKPSHRVEFLNRKGTKKPNMVYRLLGDVGKADRWEKLPGIVCRRVLHAPGGSYNYKKKVTIPEDGICRDVLSHVAIDQISQHLHLCPIRSWRKAQNREYRSDDVE